MRQYLMFIVLIVGCSIADAQVYNRVVPPGIQPYTFKQNGAAVCGTYLTAPVTIHPTKPGFGEYVEPQVMIDKDGYVMWYGSKADAVLNTDFKYHPKHQLFSYCACIDSDKYVYYILDKKLKIVDSVVNLNGVKPDVHDFLILPNGNYLLAGRLDSTVNLGEYVLNNQQNTISIRLMGFVMQEISRKHELVWQWNSNEHLNPADYIEAYGRKSELFDYCHGNSISIASDGNYIVSFRNFDAAYKIDSKTGNILWTLGGKHSSFMFTNNVGLSGQHHVQQLPNGNIIAFNNGNTLSEKQSYAIEFQLDTIEHTATRVWKSPLQKGLYAVGMGSFQKFENGNKVVAYGQVFLPNPSVQVFDKSDNVTAEFFFKDSVMSYRTYLVPEKLKFPRPVVKAKKAQGHVTLCAPRGYTKYMWNTGVSSQNIEVTKEGTYMVWVNYNSGMLGSVPVIITKDDFHNRGETK